MPASRPAAATDLTFYLQTNQSPGIVPGLFLLADSSEFDFRSLQADKTISLAVSRACDARRPIDLLSRGVEVGPTYFEQTVDLMPLKIGRSRTIAASCRWRR